MKILFIVPYPTEGASNRLRVEQYIPYLESKGIEYRIRPFISKAFYRVLYSKGNYLRKSIYFLSAALKRLFDIIISTRYNIIFIHRECFPFGPPFIEYILSKLKKSIIFDFDDAIFLSSTSAPNNFVERFKRPDKVSKIISLSKYVIAGNKYLADFAKKHNSNVTIIPTPIDTFKYRPQKSNRLDGKVIIGWIGSNTTKVFLYPLANVFKELSKNYHYVEFRIIGGDIHIDGLSSLKKKKWELETEIEDLQDFDIGIMPMPDNEWTKGKCGFKIILYMALGVPVICSPTGVNKEIVEDGKNGYFANSDREWIDKLSILIENPNLRYEMGQSGRDIVKERYSVEVNAPKFLAVLNRVCSE